MTWLTEAQLLVGRLQDALAVWDARDPSRPVAQVRRAADEASRCHDALVVIWDRERRALARDIGAYDDAVRRGGLDG